jgi:hypothetical protein
MVPSPCTGRERSIEPEEIAAQEGQDRIAAINDAISATAEHALFIHGQRGTKSGRGRKANPNPGGMKNLGCCNFVTWIWLK